jgi:uncharacterized membrane protein
MMGAIPAGSVEPSQDERTMALLAHILQLVGWWIAPLIIFVVKRESRFVSFHALQAFLLQLFYMIVMGVFMVLWFSTFFLTLAHHGGSSNAAPLPVFFVLFPLIWLGFMALWAMMLVIGIVYGIKAGRGEWAEYPVLGPLSRRILKIGPGGALTT